MTSFVARLGLAVACLLGLATGPVWAQPSQPLVLGPQASLQVSSELSGWVDERQQATVEEAATQPELFSNTPALHRFALNEHNALWLHLQLRRTIDAPTQWALNIPLPFVDEVSLYQRDAQGHWQRQHAGDTVVQAAWSLRGPYPDFALELPDTEVHDVYLRLRNFKHLSVPIRIATASEREYQRALELVVLGTFLGILAVLVVLSVIRYVEHRNLADIGAAAFSALVLAASAQVNGILNLLLWTRWPAVGDYAYAVLPPLAVGASLLFVRVLYASSTHFARYDRLLRAVGVVALLSVTLIVVDRTVADKISTVLILLATTAGLVATFLSWRGHSRIWIWLMAAYVPQWLCLTRMMLEALGLLPIWWEMRYLMSLSVALSVPMLVYALSRTTHDRKELHVRARHLPTQDALTGLLTREAFEGELAQAYDRVIDAREPVAVVVVRIVNHEHIRKGLGDTVAEQSVLRAVVKLHRILRDVDPAGRIGAGEFALIFDGVLNRQLLTERMVQLIGSGLIPLPGLHPPITLQFHAACVLLHENPIAPETAVESLRTLLDGMSSHTRRPIRFLEAPQTQPVPLMATGSSLP